MDKMDKHDSSHPLPPIRPNDRPDADRDRAAVRAAAPDEAGEDATPQRQGDILGLGGEIRKAPGDHVDSSKPGSSHGRTLTQGDGIVVTPAPHGSGATSIDMGSGGSGTDLE